MTDGFTRHRRSGRAVATFSSYEADLLRSLAGQLIELLRSESASVASDPLEQLLDMSGPTDPPEDPVLARLLPTAYTAEEDDEAAGEFRRYTEGTLRSNKATAAGVLMDSLTEAGLGDEPEADEFIDVELDQSQRMAWLRTLTDMRLAIGVRLGVEDGDEEQWEALPEDDPRTRVWAIYQWLGYLQETLVLASDG